MLLFVLLFIFIFGICIGSFLNVLIDRLPENESPFHGRSHCDHCRKVLQAKDLIPLLSFVLLSGKCRYCHKKLSWQYPAIELLVGLMFVGLFWWFMHGFLASEAVYFMPANFTPQTFLNFLSLVAVFSSLLVIFMTDMKTQIIPDEITVLLGVSAFLYRLANNTFGMQHIIAAFLASGVFYAIYLVTKKRGLGFGDVKLVAAMGILLGGVGTIIALYAAFLTGAVVSLILVLVAHKTGKTQIAFAPFLIFGTVVSFFWAPQIVDWYLQFLL